MSGRVRAGVVADVAAIEGTACMASVERTRYAPRTPDSHPTCAALLAVPRGSISWRSRLRLNVKAGAAADEFALTDAGPFETSDIGGILRAANAGGGEFSAFLRQVIEGQGAPLQSRGIEDTPLGKLLVLGFTVPVENSRFRNAPRAAYRGSLFAMADSGNLRRLTLEAEDAGDAEDAGEACRVQYTTDYTSNRAGSSEVVVPQNSTMEAILRNGEEVRSETYYSSCQRAAANKPMATPVAPKPLPPNVKLRVRFEPSIDGETAATGDPVIGIIRNTVKDKQNGVIVHAGDRLHGRIALIEQYLAPQPRWDVAVVFETIERGVGEHGIDRGVEQPVSLVPVGQGAQAPQGTATETAGAGYFVFQGPTPALLDQRFETEWETR